MDLPKKKVKATYNLKQRKGLAGSVRLMVSAADKPADADLS